MWRGRQIYGRRERRAARRRSDLQAKSRRQQKGRTPRSVAFHCRDGAALQVVGEEIQS